jgi:hypothetical protein
MGGATGSPQAAQGRLNARQRVDYLSILAPSSRSACLRAASRREE